MDEEAQSAAADPTYFAELFDSSPQFKDLIPSQQCQMQMNNSPILIDELGPGQFCMFDEKDVEALKSRCRTTCESGLVDLGIWHLLPEAVHVLCENGLVKIRRPTLTSTTSDPLYEDVGKPNFANDAGYGRRLTVYRDLWRKGFYLTAGTKFGCDFLAYEKAPGEVHSKYLVLCLGSQESITPLNLISVSRLASQVKKTVLLSFVSSDSLIPYYVAGNWWKGDK